MVAPRRRTGICLSAIQSRRDVSPVCKGVSQDKAEAVKWYRRAAEQGIAKAQFNLGVMYAKARAFPRQGGGGQMVSPRRQNRGMPKAQYNLGVMYDHGVGNFARQGEIERCKWYRRAAEQGIAEAQHNLGLMYDKLARAFHKTRRKRSKWYRRAAEQGIAQAQCNLGVMYDQGDGVSQDKRKRSNGSPRRRTGNCRSARQSRLDVSKLAKAKGFRKDQREAYIWFSSSRSAGHFRKHPHTRIKPPKNCPPRTWRRRKKKPCADTRNSAQAGRAGEKRGMTLRAVALASSGFPSNPLQSREGEAELRGTHSQAELGNDTGLSFIGEAGLRFILKAVHELGPCRQARPGFSAMGGIGLAAEIPDHARLREMVSSGMTMGGALLPFATLRVVAGACGRWTGQPACRRGSGSPLIFLFWGVLSHAREWMAREG